MKVRIISGLIGALLFVAVLLAGGYILEAAICIVAFMASYEMFSAMGLRGKSIFSLGMLSPLSLVLFCFFGTKYIAVFFMAFLFAALAIMVFCHEKVTFNDVAKLICGAVMINFCLAFIILLERMENGNVLVFTPIACACASDTFAYFTGSFLGKHKLIPKISPKKTVEGAVGGLLGGILAMVVIAIILKQNIVIFAIAGLVCAAISQVGDLIASAIKRECGIKDYGNLIPGHGGIMDRVDSILFASPAIYFFISGVIL